MCMNDDQEGRAGTLVAILSRWVAPVVHSALCAALEPGIHHPLC